MSVRTLVPARPSHTTRSRVVFGWVASVIAALAMFGLAAPAGAQTANTLQSIEPADGATLEQSPTEITLAFNQEVGGDDAVSLQLACSSQPQATGLPEVDADGLVVIVAVDTPVPRGACTITWELSDGLGETITSGFSTFSVTSDPPASETGDVTESTDPLIRTTVPPAEADSGDTATVDEGSSGGAVWLGRFTSTLGILVLFGALALISVGWPEGPEYVVTIRFLRAIWVVALLGTLLYLVAFAADVNDVSFGAAMSPTQWFDLTDAGWSGRGALLRLVFVVASAGVAFRPERIIDPTSAMWAWALPGFALVAVAMTRIAGPAALLGFVVSIAHVFSVAVWVGGAALVARVVLAGPGEEDLVQATRAFSRISVPAMLIAAITGVIQVVRLVGGDLFGTSHGQVLLLKVIAVAAMLAVALAARQQVTMRLDRAHELTVPLADRFRRAFGAEAALGVVVLAFSGWLLGLTPANVDPFADETYIDPIQFIDAASGVEATVLIGPSQVGLNGIRVEVEEPPEGITNLILRFIPPDGSDAFIVEQAIPLTGAGTAVLRTAEGLPFTASGVWTIELDASTTAGVGQGAAFTFLVRSADGSVVTTPETSPPMSVDVSRVEQSTTTAPFATSPPVLTVPPTSAPGG